jgi:hypothetical protein
MPLLKLSNNSNNNNMILKLNERIITPDSIPVFVLPPTLDSCRNSRLVQRSLSISSRMLFFLVTYN